MKIKLKILIALCERGLPTMARVAELHTFDNRYRDQFKQTSNLEQYKNYII